MSFLEEQCTLGVLTSEILEQCNPFDCGNPDLNEFFVNDCIDYHRELIGKSYCFTLDENPKEIVCAFTVSNDSIKVNDLPGSRKRKVTSRIPREKHFRSYPAVLIGRLGVNNLHKGKHEGKHVSKELMDFIKSWFIDPFNKTGCRFLVVDAYNDGIATSYYQTNDFEYVFSSEDQEKEYYNKGPEEMLNSRLMLFDLILLKSE